MTKNKLSHIALILDGNKRWAQNNKYSNFEGYKKGLENIKTITDYALSIGLSNLTLFTLSSENFNRSSVNIIYDIINKNFSNLIADLIEKKKIKVNIFGSRENLPEKINNIFNDAENKTKNNKDLQLNLAFNYGFKDEIKHVLKTFKSKFDKIDINNFSEINNLFYLGNMRDPDILIRTGGYQRLSNFIMFNLTYSELFFTDTLWPDFSPTELNQIIDKFLITNRKYGL